MKHLVRFLLLLGLGLAILWAAVGKEGIFPSREKPESPAPLEQPHVPAIRVDQGSGAVSVAPRGKLNIRSSRPVRLPGGKVVQLLRYSLSSANAQPNPDGTYTLYKAVLTFYRGREGAPVPAAVIRAARMNLSMVTGKEGIRPMENQEMTLEKVRIRTGRALEEADLLLETEKLLVRTTREETSFRTPAADTPYTLSGTLAGGELKVKGLGLEGSLPPPERKDSSREPAPGEEPPFRLLGRSRNAGTWRPGKKGPLLSFSSEGPFLLERKKGSLSLRITLEKRVRLERKEAGRTARLAAASLQVRLLPGRALKEGRPEGRIRSLAARGTPVVITAREGVFQAEEVRALFREDGSFLALKAQGNPSLREERPQGRTFQASCRGPLTLVSLEGLSPLFRPFAAFPGASQGRPASLVTLSGPSRITLESEGGPGRLRCREGIRLLLSRGREILGLAGFGETRLSASGLEGRSDRGISLARAPFFQVSGLSRTRFHPPGDRTPARFSVAASGKKGKGRFTLEGVGFLSNETLPGGRSRISARAAGPWGRLTARGSSPRGDFLLEEAREIRIFRGPGDKTEIRAETPFPGVLRAAFPARKVTAWAARLEGDAAKTRLFGGEERPVLLRAPVEDKEGGTTRLELLAGQVLLQEGRTLLHAVKGVKLRFTGKGVLPGAQGSKTTLSASEMFLFSGREKGKPERVLLSGKVAILSEGDSGTTRGRGKDLWISLAEKKAVLSGSPAVIRASGGGGRTLEVISEIIRLSREETVAGDLASGIGGKIVISSEQGVFGGAGGKGGRIEAVCGMPIHLKGDYLVFPGATILQWVDGSPKEERPVLVCGSMVARRGPGGGEPFLWIKGEKGVKFRKGEFQGTGESLFFRPGPGLLRIEGGSSPCTLGLGDQAFRGKRITLNIHDFTWKVEGSATRRVPLAAAARKERRETP